MAGCPNKEGLDFYKIDTDIEDDRKVEQLFIEQPEKGYELYMRLLTRIYKEYGYFIEWNERQARYMAGRCATTKDRIDSIIETCLRERLFSRDIYDQHRRKKIYIIQPFALFTPTLIESLKIQKSAYYLTFDNLQDVFLDGFLHEDYLRIATHVLIVPAGTAQVVEEAGKEPAEEVAPVTNGRTYGDPVILPVNFDWEKEKKLLLADEEWKTVTTRNFKLGKWDDRTWMPDFCALETWMEDFFEWMVLKGTKKTAQMMKGHFIAWFPKREFYLEQIGKKRTSPLHVGKQDYGKQTTW
jgi:hypothetical protein